MKRLKLDILWLFVGFSILLLYGYYDSIRFPLIPIFSEAFNVNYARTSLFLSFGYLGAVISSLILLLFVYKSHLKNISLCILSGMILICVSAFFIDNYYSLILYGTIYGAFVTLLNSVSNMIILNNAPAHLTGKFISAGQALYGVSCICVPWIVAKIFTSGIGWKYCFYLSLPFAIVLVIFILISKYRENHGIGVIEEFKKSNNPHLQLKEVRLSFLEKISILVFSLYVTGEVLGVSWMTTILIEKYSFNVDSAKHITIGMFIVFVICRLLCATVSTPKNEKVIILSALFLSTLGFILGGCVDPLFFIIFGMISPVYPLFVANITRRNPIKTNAIALWILVETQLILCCLTFVLGHVLDILGVHFAMAIPPLVLIIALAGLCVLIPNYKKDVLAK